MQALTNQPGEVRIKECVTNHVDMRYRPKNIHKVFGAMWRMS